MSKKVESYTWGDIAWYFFVIFVIAPICLFFAVGLFISIIDYFDDERTYNWDSNERYSEVNNRGSTMETAIQLPYVEDYKNIVRLDDAELWWSMKNIGTISEEFKEYYNLNPDYDYLWFNVSIGINSSDDINKVFSYDESMFELVGQTDKQSYIPIDLNDYTSKILRMYPIDIPNKYYLKLNGYEGSSTNGILIFEVPKGRQNTRYYLVFNVEENEKKWYLIPYIF